MSDVDVEPSDDEEDDERLRYKLPLLAFLLTVASVYYTHAHPTLRPLGLGDWREGVSFTGALLAILVTHEFGHFIAARLHRVPASLPYFIPMPELSPFGTMGALIGMQARIRSRRALLDIGAAGPLAGMVVALPVLAYGLHLSEVKPQEPGSLLEGHSILYELMLKLFAPPIPAGSDVFLHPIAFAGWAGLFVTMINLVPFGQLDGGHIAYALFGKRQDRYARVVRWCLPPLFFYNLAKNYWPLRHAPLDGDAISKVLGGSTFWLVWFGMLTLMMRLSRGQNHPPTDAGEELGTGRKIVAVFSLVLFVLLFMPSPLTPG